MSSLVELQNLYWVSPVRAKRKSFVLGPISAQFDLSGSTAVVGSNGCGKTTLLRLLTQCYRPKSGSINWVHGVPRFGFLNPDGNLNEYLTVLDHCRHYQRISGHRSTIDWITRFNLTDHLKSLPQDLSFGQRQRVRLASVMCTNPEVLLLDEPATGLDINARMSLNDALTTLIEEGVAIVMATHEIDQMLACDNLILLNQGKLVYAGRLIDLDDDTLPVSRMLRSRMVTDLTTSTKVYSHA
jgi:ABC-2 type transport system ATP-binding protein